VGGVATTPWRRDAGRYCCTDECRTGTQYFGRRKPQQNGIRSFCALNSEAVRGSRCRNTFAGLSPLLHCWLLCVCGKLLIHIVKELQDRWVNHMWINRRMGKHLLCCRFPEGSHRPSRKVEGHHWPKTQPAEGEDTTAFLPHFLWKPLPRSFSSYHLSPHISLVEVNQAFIA